MSKYFVVNSREKAMSLKNKTGQRYMVFGENYSFVKTEELLQAWEETKKELKIGNYREN